MAIIDITQLPNAASVADTDTLTVLNANGLEAVDALTLQKYVAANTRTKTLLNPTADVGIAGMANVARIIYTAAQQLPATGVVFTLDNTKFLAGDVIQVYLKAAQNASLKFVLQDTVNNVPINTVAIITTAPLNKILHVLHDGAQLTILP